MVSQLRRQVTRDVNECIGGTENVVEDVDESLGGFTVKLSVDTITNKENSEIQARGYSFTTKAVDGTLTLVLKPTAEKKADLLGE